MIMKTIIETKTAGKIVISSIFMGNKLWDADTTMQNYNNHKVTVKNNGQKYSFDFWGSILYPEITTDDENINAFYCSLSDGILAYETFEFFCSELGYDTDSRKAKKTYKACEKTLNKLKRVFDCDLYDLINEVQDNYCC